MRLLTGDECGLIKETLPEEGRPKKVDKGPTNTSSHPITVKKGIRRIDEERQTRTRGVQGMTWMQDRTTFATLRANASIELWEGSFKDGVKKPGNYTVTDTVDDIFESSSSTGRPLMSLGYTKERLCAVDSMGNVAIINPSKASVVANYSAYASSKQGGTIGYTKGKVENTQMATSMATTPTSGQIAIGGRERESTILDIYTGQQVWKAKNLAPDPQTLLQQPVWSTALTFLSDSLLLSGTAYKQVRLYDIRSNSRRPVSYTPEGLLEHRVTALCSVDEHNFAVGDAAGSLSVLDLRKHLGKSKKSAITSVPRFVGPVGSIRQIVCHPTKPWLACVGLDRMLRVYSTRSRRQMDCVYLKQRVNSVLFCADEEWPAYDEIEIGDTDINAEDEVEDYVDSDEESGDGANAHEESSDSDDDDEELKGSDDDDGSSEEEESDDDDGDSDSSEEPEMDEDEEPETGKDELFQSKKKKPRR